MIKQRVRYKKDVTESDTTMAILTMLSAATASLNRQSIACADVSLSENTQFKGMDPISLKTGTLLCSFPGAVSVCRQQGTKPSASASEYLSRNGTIIPGASLSALPPVTGHSAITVTDVPCPGSEDNRLFISLKDTSISAYTDNPACPVPVLYLRETRCLFTGEFCFTPMSRGLQIGRALAFSGAREQPDFRRAEIILEKARKLVPGLNISSMEFGVGHRLFLPDTRPVIDHCRRLLNVLLVFGHGQPGLTLGATTGRLIADLVPMRAPAQDLSPFSANRFLF